MGRILDNTMERPATEVVKGGHRNRRKPTKWYKGKRVSGSYIHQRTLEVKD